MQACLSHRILSVVAGGTLDFITTLNRGAGGHVSYLKANIWSKFSSHTYKHLDYLYIMFLIYLNI